MFSTGPMFLSIQFAIWTSSHAAAPSGLIHILLKSLNRHADDDDAAFIGFLGYLDNRFMFAALVVLIAGLASMALPIREHRHIMRLMGWKLDSNRPDLPHFYWRITRFQLEDDGPTLNGSSHTGPIRRY
ncbi:hypothetical protein EDD18DRAFT_1342740 [Armillaria luteobubalina]|uniref:Uncharacterized protein n=1 Tax=Armillaria luteobubalina TaxID=153913 RepID=A0AA39QQ62_9AGAR|nr:hypothetical protein EDD18DRAFT_1342740 [Armillaria luteobubalina]